jgi:hypothetical protein
MKTTRPVFESFTAFVNNLYEMESQYPGFFNSLNEADTTYASPLLKLLKGTMKLPAQSATEVDTLVLQTFNKIFTDNSKDNALLSRSATGKSEMANLIELLTEAFDLIRNSSGLATVPGSVVSSEIPTEYKYLQSGNVRGKDLPEVDNSNTPDMTTESLDVPLPIFLLTLNAHNLIALYNLITGAKKGKAYVNAGSEANFDQFNRMSKDESNWYNFVEIDTNSLNGELITLKPYVSTYVKIDAAKIKDESKEAKAKREKEEKEKLTELNKVKYGWQFPLYGLSETAITPLGGELIDASYYDKVIEPGGNDVAVEDQEYSAPPESTFFPADGVIISDSGKQALNLILSEFNSIKTIKVNGGASSSPTTRAGGNEQLAKDRMAAGIAQLNLLKKNGVKQLKDAVISEGIASVQTSGGKSDPKKQQVTFTISGMIKTIKVTPKKEVTIPTMETVKADSVKFTKYIFQLNLNEEPNSKNMAERA